MSKPTFGQRFRYWFDGVMAKGTASLISLLAIVTLVLIAVIAAVVLMWQVRQEGAEPQGVAETFWLNLMHALDAGTVAGDVGWGYRGLMLLVTIGGLFVVASLISIISGAFDSKVEELRKGRSTVIESGHTVILGWNSKVRTIVSELSIANESERKPAIVILADMDKVEMEDMIKAAVPNLRGTRVVCRSGDPQDQDDLLLVNPFGARSIIVLGDEDSEDPDARAIKTVLALTGHPEHGDKPLHIVGQIREKDNVEVANLVGKGEVRWILAHEKIGQITAQTSRQPGLSSVYNELLDFDGDEMYFTHQSELVGKTYGEAQYAFVDCAVMGIVRDGVVVLNPAAGEKIGQKDELLVIAEDDATIVIAPAGVADASALATGKSPKPKAEKTLVLGFNKRVPGLLREVDQYNAPGSSVTILSEVPVEGVGTLPNSTVKTVSGSTTARASLAKVKPLGFDHVIVVAYRDDMGVQDADGKTLITLLHLREMMAESDAKLNIVSEMLDDKNRKLAMVAAPDDFIVSDNVISMMMSQVSENPILADVFDALFGADGAEVYLRPAEWYVQLGVELDFYTVLAGAAKRKETAIGYRIAATDDAPAEVLVNPNKAGTVTFAPGDRIVVLAED